MGQFITVDLSELENMERILKALSLDFHNAEIINDEITNVAIDMRNYIIEGMTNTKKQSTGYRRGTKTHFPSVPGHMPARDTGELVSRMTWDQTGNKVQVGVEAGAPYAIWLEEGTTNMKERPFLQPTLEHFSPSIEQRLWNRIKGAVNK